VNLIGAFQMARVVKAPMDAAVVGVIVTVSSVADIAGVGSPIPYCASKAIKGVVAGLRAPVRHLEYRAHVETVGRVTDSPLDDCYLCKGVRASRDDARVERYFGCVKGDR
jgi:NADP-dependent 3-hydroxy acid dehydrogenase YdfG